MPAKPAPVVVRPNKWIALWSAALIGLTATAFAQGPAGTPAPPGATGVPAYDQPATLVYHPQPTYPLLAKQARIAGAVRFTAVIGRDGTVQKLTLVSGNPLLVAAAQEAAQKWRYKPALRNGEPVEAVTQIEISFTLPEQPPGAGRPAVASSQGAGNALITAAMIGNLPRVKALLDARGDVNARDDNGGTALMAASEQGHLDVVRALLDARADVNARAGDGGTALTSASVAGAPSGNVLRLKRPCRFGGTFFRCRSFSLWQCAQPVS